jgi:hypothetical protein
VSAQLTAPVSVYQTVRHLEHDLSFPDIDDGDYVVRLHFGDDAANTGRRMEYSIEGQLLVADFSPGVEAGAGYVALARQIPVTVSDGNGLHIEARKGSGDDVFEAGIEILLASQVNLAPFVDAGADTVIELDATAFLFAAVNDDGRLNAVLMLQWSQVSGPGEASFADPSSTTTSVTFSAVGDYLLTLVADDGELQGHDEIAVRVLPPASITILQPAGGEVWRVGTEQHIDWTTVGISDVAMHYSTDRGATWSVIEYTVDAVSRPDLWGHYPWTVPDTASSECVIKIIEYNAAEPFAHSGIFAIAHPGEDAGALLDASTSTDRGTTQDVMLSDNVMAADTKDEGVQVGDGCACAGSDSAMPALAFLTLPWLTCFRRRHEILKSMLVGEVACGPEPRATGVCPTANH